MKTSCPVNKSVMIWNHQKYKQKGGKLGFTFQLRVGFLVNCLMWNNNNSFLSSVQQRRWLKALTKLVLNISNLFEEVVYFLSLNKHLGKKQRGSARFFICKFLLYEKSRLYTYDNLVVYLASQKLKYKSSADFRRFFVTKKSKAYNWSSSFFNK